MLYRPFLTRYFVGADFLDFKKSIGLLLLQRDLFLRIHNDESGAGHDVLRTFLRQGVSDFLHL